MDQNEEGRNDCFLMWCFRFRSLLHLMVVDIVAASLSHVFGRVKVVASNQMAVEHDIRLRMPFTLSFALIKITFKSEFVIIEQVLHRTEHNINYPQITAEKHRS